MSMSREKPELNGEAATSGQRTDGRSGDRKQARKPGEWKYHIYQLPENPDEQKRFVVTLPVDADPEQYIEDNEPAGIYRIEKKRGGEFSSEAWKYRWSGEPDEPLDEEEEEIGMPGVVARHDPEPASASNGYDEERIVKLVASAVGATFDARERTQAARTSNGAPDPMEQFRQMRELLKDERAEMREEMRSMLPKVNESIEKQNPETLTIEKAILHLVSQDENAIQNVASRLLGNGQEQSNWSAVFKPLLNSIGQNLPGVLSTVAAAARAQQQPASTPIQPNAPQPPTPAQNPTPEPTAAPTPVPTSQSTPQTGAPPCAPASDEAGDDKPLTVVEVLENLFEDMHKAAAVGECAEELITFAKDNPNYATTIESLMTSPPEAVLQMLDQATSNTMKEITGAMHAPAWIDKLQLEMQRLKGTMTNSETVKAS